MFLALYSAYTETPVPNTLALTGEIGLHGQILPVGGVEDKLEAAQQAGATLALIPQENWREVYREIEVVPVGDAETLLRRVSRPARGRRSRRAWNFWWDRRSDNKSKKRRKCMMICRKKKDAFAGGKFHPSVFGKRRCISKRAKPILSLCDGRK